MNPAAPTVPGAPHVDKAERIAQLRDELAQAEHAQAQIKDYLRGLPNDFAASGKAGARLSPQELARTTGAALALDDRLSKQVDALRAALMRVERADLPALERIRLAGLD